MFCVDLRVRFPVALSGARAWVMPACRGGRACGSTVRGPVWRGGSSFLRVSFLAVALPGTGREHGDLGFPGDGLLGSAGVGELGPCFLRPLGIPVAY